MTKQFYLYTTILFFICVSHSLAQQAAPPINPEPLARPKYLTVVQSKDAKQLLKAISDSISHNGFTVSQFDLREYQLEATRPEGSGSKDHDKILVWLERDISDQETMRVYLLYGRFMEILAGKSGTYRIMMSAAAEEQRIGKLKQSLVSLSTIH